MKLRFTPRATRDLAEIADHLRTRSPSAALAVRDAILRSLQNLTLFPYVGDQRAYDQYRQQMSTQQTATDQQIRAILSTAPLPGEGGLL